MKLSGDTKAWNSLLITSLVVLAVAIRLLPHPPNFTPVAAISLFSAVYFRQKYYVVFPLTAMFVSDLVIGFAEIWVTLSIYLSFGLIYLIGRYLRQRKNTPNTFFATLAGSVSFFLITNFAVWAATGWYDKSWAGLVKCFWLAIPFFRNTLLGDLFYVTVLFGAYELIRYYSTAKRLKIIKIKN